MMSLAIAVLYAFGGTSASPQDAAGECALLLDTLDLALQAAEQDQLQWTQQQQLPGQVSLETPSQQQQAAEQTNQQQQGQCGTCLNPQQMQQLCTDASTMQSQGQLTMGQALTTQPDQEQLLHRQKQGSEVSAHTAQETETLLRQQQLQEHLVHGRSFQGELQLLDHETESQQQADLRNALVELLLWGLHTLRVVATALGRGIQTNCATMMTDYVLQRFNLFSSCWPLDISKLAVEVTAPSYTCTV